jgi:hypothetical protein
MLIDGHGGKQEGFARTGRCRAKAIIEGFADVAELVDALDLGSSAARRGGSSPFIRTNFGMHGDAIVTQFRRSRSTYMFFKQFRLIASG